MVWVDTGGARRVALPQVIQAYFVEHWIQLSLISFVEGAFFQANQAIVQEQQHRNALRWVQRLWR